jgi:hypothetical protein
MKISPKFITAFSWLLLTSVVALADTNLVVYCQTRPFNLSISGWTNGPINHDGILSFTRSREVRLSNQGLIETLNGKPVYTLAKALTNWITIKTNHNPNPIPDDYVTNHFQQAYLVRGPAVPANFSSGARLFLLEPLGVNSPGPIPIVRDGSPPIDYSIADYFLMRNVGFEQIDQSVVIRSAKYDNLHELVDSTEASIKSFVFDDQSPTLAGHVSFDLQGLASERVASIIRTNALVATRAGRQMSASVSGLGFVGSTNNLAVLRGAVTAGDGKLEFK